MKPVPPPTDRAVDFSPWRVGESVVFGRRRVPPSEACARRERLDALRSELNLFLFGTEDEAVVSQFSTVMTGGEPALLIGDGVDKLSVEIDRQSGSLVLRGEGETAFVLVTASSRRVIDSIIGHLAESGGPSPLATRDPVDRLIGSSLEEIRRRLVLRTLVNFGGDRRLTAKALGIDEAALAALVRHCVLPSSRAPEARS